MTTEPNSYEPNSIYFFVLFDDPDLRVPIIRTVRVIRKAHRDDGVSILLFEDISSINASEKLAFEESRVSEVVLNGADRSVETMLCRDPVIATHGLRPTGSGNA